MIQLLISFSIISYLRIIYKVNNIIKINVITMLVQCIQQEMNDTDHIIFGFIALNSLERICNIHKTM